MNNSGCFIVYNDVTPYFSYCSITYPSCPILKLLNSDYQYHINSLLFYATAHVKPTMTCCSLCVQNAGPLLNKKSFPVDRPGGIILRLYPAAFFFFFFLS